MPRPVTRASHASPPPPRVSVQFGASETEAISRLSQGISMDFHLRDVWTYCTAEHDPPPFKALNVFGTPHVKRHFSGTLHGRWKQVFLMAILSQ